MAAMEDDGFFQFAARYKFTLSMENYVCDDYITEKVWRPLRLGSVPIIFGAPNIRRYLPDNRSAILVEDFLDVRSLAQYINYLDKNDNLYKRFLYYKNRPFQNHYLQTLLDSRDWHGSGCKRTQSDKQQHSSIFYGFECILCEKVHQQMRAESHSGSPLQSHTANSSHYSCPGPRRFDSQGRYRVNDRSWSREWYYGKFEAEAMSLLYQQRKTVSEKEFHQMVVKMADSDMAT